MLINLYLCCIFQAGVEIEIVRVLPESPPPNLSNIFCTASDIEPSNMV